MTEPMLPSDDLDVLAAELAFGLLDGAEKASALRRELEDRAFAAMAAAWRSRAEAWTEDQAPEEIDDRIWSHIQLALGHADGPEAAGRSYVSRDRRWRGLALLASAASLMLAVALGVTLASRPTVIADVKTPPPLAPETSGARDTNIAQIADKDGAPLLSAVYYARTGTLSLRAADLETPDKAPELWVLDKAGKPHSLGLVDKRDGLTITISDRLRALLVEGATIAITVEDREGAPHEAPKGVILGTAKLATL